YQSVVARQIASTLRRSTPPPSGSASSPIVVTESRSRGTRTRRSASGTTGSRGTVGSLFSAAIPGGRLGINSPPPPIRRPASALRADRLVGRPGRALGRPVLVGCALLLVDLGEDLVGLHEPGDRLAAAPR